MSPRAEPDALVEALEQVIYNTRVGGTDAYLYAEDLAPVLRAALRDALEVMGSAVTVAEHEADLRDAEAAFLHRLKEGV